MLFAAEVEEATRSLWEHPMVIAISAPLIVAFVLGVTAGIRRIITLGNEILRRMDGMESKVAEVKNEITDVKKKVVAQEERTERLDGDLRKHMGDESRDRADDRRERRGELARVHERIDDLVKVALAPALGMTTTSATISSTAATRPSDEGS